MSPCEAELEPSALVCGSCGTTASGLAAPRLGSPSSGFSPGATAYLASRGQGKHALPLDGYPHVNELVPPARGWARLWLVAGLGQWCGDWQRGPTRSGRFKGQEGAECSPNKATRNHSLPPQSVQHLLSWVCFSLSRLRLKCPLANLLTPFPGCSFTHGGIPCSYSCLLVVVSLLPDSLKGNVFCCCSKVCRLMLLPSRLCYMLRKIQSYVERVGIFWTCSCPVSTSSNQPHPVGESFYRFVSDE